ncbi:MAG: hypothetical protein DRO11_00195 [Methanobacteriota archaeon]|nr:MAG: hypothetical protein DRO11_00195 [Euryarchaeota archaeon]
MSSVDEPESPIDQAFTSPRPAREAFETMAKRIDEALKGVTGLFAIIGRIGAGKSWWRAFLQEYIYYKFKWLFVYLSTKPGDDDTRFKPMLIPKLVNILEKVWNIKPRALPCKIFHPLYLPDMPAFPMALDRGYVTFDMFGRMELRLLSGGQSGGLIKPKEIDFLEKAITLSGGPRYARVEDIVDYILKRAVNVSDGFLDFLLGGLLNDKSPTHPNEIFSHKLDKNIFLVTSKLANPMVKLFFLITHFRAYKKYIQVYEPSIRTVLGVSELKVMAPPQVRGAADYHAKLDLAETATQFRQQGTVVTRMWFESQNLSIPEDLASNIRLMWIHPTALIGKRQRKKFCDLFDVEPRTIDLAINRIMRYGNKMLIPGQFLLWDSREPDIIYIPPKPIRWNHRYLPPFPPPASMLWPEPSTTEEQVKMKRLRDTMLKMRPVEREYLEFYGYKQTILEEIEARMLRKAQALEGEEIYKIGYPIPVADPKAMLSRKYPMHLFIIIYMCYEILREAEEEGRKIKAISRLAIARRARSKYGIPNEYMGRERFKKPSHVLLGNLEALGIPLYYDKMEQDWLFVPQPDFMKHASRIVSIIDDYFGGFRKFAEAKIGKRLATKRRLYEEYKLLQQIKKKKKKEKGGENG